MKFTFLILTFCCVLQIRSQSDGNNLPDYPSPLHHTHTTGDFYSADFFSGTVYDVPHPLFVLEGERVNFLNLSSFEKPLPPVLTTPAADLEVCNGNSTRLTASSSSLIRWYNTPPPTGIPIGTGPIYITPTLSTGYYTFYAIAEEGGVKSDISAMEVVMVYPTPALNILSSAATLCTNVNATLTVSGTTYYQWENGLESDQMAIRPEHTTTYKVTGVNTAGCKSVGLYTQFVEMCSISEEKVTVGIKNSLTDKKLYKVYPNPNNGEFNVSVNSVSENTKVEIYNSFGQLIYSSKVTSEVTIVDLKAQIKGIYILRISENDQIFTQEKIVRQ